MIDITSLIHDLRTKEPTRELADQVLLACGYPQTLISSLKVAANAGYINPLTNAQDLIDCVRTFRERTHIRKSIWFFGRVESLESRHLCFAAAEYIAAFRSEK